MFLPTLVFVSVFHLDFSDKLLKAGWIKGKLKDVVLTASIHVETKHCKTLFINTAPPSCMLSSRGLKSTDTGNISEGIREIGLWEKFRGAIFGRDGVRKDRVVYSAEKWSSDCRHGAKIDSRVTELLHIQAAAGLTKISYQTCIETWNMN